MIWLRMREEDQMNVWLMGPAGEEITVGPSSTKVKEADADEGRVRNSESDGRKV